MIINNNIPALNTYRQMGINNTAGSKAMEKLSSGMRINRAGDDAAGLAISEKMRAQIRGLDQASRNAQDGISMIQTAEGALQEAHNILQRMRELANQAANDTNVEIDRNEIQKEINQLSSEINRIGNTTEFNTQKILNGGIDSNGSDKITQATSATIAGSAINMATASGATLSGKITVDGRTFDLSTVDFSATSTGAISTVVDAIKSATSGGVKLSDYLDVTVNASNELVFTAKSSGSTSTIQFDSVKLGSASLIDDGKVKGDPTLIERVGMQAGSALSAAGTLNIDSTNNTLTVKIGTNDFNDVDVTEVNIKLETGKSYDLGTDAGRADFINAINAAIQKAGLEGSVMAALSKDNELQLISQTGQDFAVDSNSTLLGAAGLNNAGDVTSGLTNVDQVVGPGAQGSGFTAKFQIGANQGQSINLNINDMRAAALGITGNAGQAGFTSGNSVTNGTNDIMAEAALDVSTHESASAAITVINNALEKVSAERSNLGAIQNRLEHTISNLNNSSENLQAAESRIRDVDMAKEIMEMTRANILGQASQAMLAQANQKPQSVLQLLG